MVDIRVEISGEGCVLFALLCLVLPLEWVFAGIFAGIIHELSHILVIFLTGGSIQWVKIGAMGAVIQISPMERGKEWICALAGPIGSFALMMTARFFPRMALCALIQGIYNLLPIYPLDGGRAAACIIEMIFPAQMHRRIMHILEGIICFLILMGGLWCSICTQWGIWPFALALFFLCRTMAGKIPCKDGKDAVQ